MASTAAGGAGAALADAFSTTSKAPRLAARFPCVSFMRHSIANHNEAAAASAEAMGLVYLSEQYADSSLSPRGHALVRRARQSMLGLSPTPSVVLCSPLTRAIETAIGMFGGTGIRIVAVPEAREAYGRFPCDRHREKSELEAVFGDSVDFSLCHVKDTVWSRHHREQMSQLDNRVARFLDGVLREEAEHVFVVSHGVFIEAALRQLAHACPGYGASNRVHNCDVHSFVFSASPAPCPDAVSSATCSPAVSSVAAVAVAASMVGGAHTASAKPSEGGMAAAASATASSAGASWGGVGSGIGGIVNGGGAKTTPPRVEVYLTGQDLALACAAEMPLTTVAHANRGIARFSRDGSNLSETQFSSLLAQCALGAQETRWLYCAMDREGGGSVASWDLLRALMAFFSEARTEAGRAAEGPGSHARHGLMDLRARYQKEMYGTPLAEYELLSATFKRILFTVLATS